MENLYEVLGCTSDATYETLKQAFQRLAKKYHPDKVRSQPARELTDNHNGSKDHNPDSESHNQERFIRIDRAWKVLADGDRRKEYDARWKQRCLVQDWPVQDEVSVGELDEEMEGVYTHPCRCGGDYVMTDTDIQFMVDYVCCSSCSLVIKIVYDSCNGSPG